MYVYIYLHHNRIYLYIYISYCYMCMQSWGISGYNGCNDTHFLDFFRASSLANHEYHDSQFIFLCFFRKKKNVFKAAPNTETENFGVVELGVC